MILVSLLDGPPGAVASNVSRKSSDTLEDVLNGTYNHLGGKFGQIGGDANPTFELNLRSIKPVAAHVHFIESARTRVMDEMQSMVLGGLTSLVSATPPLQLEGLIK